MTIKANSLSSEDIKLDCMFLSLSRCRKTINNQEILGSDFDFHNRGNCP